MFKDGPEAFGWVQEKIASGQGGTMAVAFWGANARKELGFDRRPRDSKPVTIICNLEMGGTNPSEIKQLRRLRNVEVLQADRLHGKVYLFGSEVLIGSSNASANGLSF